MSSTTRTLRPDTLRGAATLWHTCRRPSAARHEQWRTSEAAAGRGPWPLLSHYRPARDFVLERGNYGRRV